EGVALGLVLGRGLVPFGLGLLGLALLHVLHRGAQLVDRHRRLLLGVAVLQALDDGVHIDRFAALGGVAAEVVAERIAKLALLGEVSCATALPAVRARAATAAAIKRNFIR
ncbi:hypothetical protein CATMIT_01917, partial [Catenibacterium mitsuokai DSM 15897]